MGRREFWLARCRIRGSVLTVIVAVVLALAVGGCATGRRAAIEGISSQANHQSGSSSAVSSTSSELTASAATGTAPSTPGERATAALGTSGVKNVIVMIADGSGYNQFEAASIYESGTRTGALYRSFPVRVALSTYPSPEVGGSYDSAKAWASFDWVRKNPTDSAAAATALSTGVKTYQSAVGVDTQRRPLTHALERAEVSGRSTGLVTTVPISHATPAGFGAHNSSRDNYAAIANELLGRSAVDVILGAGNPYSTQSGRPRFPSTKDFDYVGGRNTWRGLEAGRIGSDADGDGDTDPFTLIETQHDFYELMSGPTPKRVCGVARVSSTLQQRRRGDTSKPAFAVSQLRNVPTLEVMARERSTCSTRTPMGSS